MAKKEKQLDATAFNCAEVERIIGYTFRDKSLLAQAFTRTSFCNEVNPTSKIKYQSSEVLEFFGDSVLSAAIVTLLLGGSAARYEGGIRTELNEGDFSNIKSKLSDKKNLSKSIHALGLQRFLRMGEGDKKLKVDEEPSVKEDLYESIIGAIYIDSGMNLQKVIPIVEKTLDLSLYNNSTPPIQSAKNTLQEWCQSKKRRLPPPEYKTLKKDGPDHKTVYEVGCYVKGELIATGKGKNEKLAGAAAAEAAMKILGGSGGKVEPEITAPESTSKTVKGANTKPKADTVKEADDKKSKRSNDPKTNAQDQSSKKADQSSKKSDQALKKTEPAKPAGTDTSYSLKLKAYAKSEGILSPSFVDLGMQKENGRIIHRVECRLKDRARIAKAESREAAKEEAARMILEELAPKSHKNQTAQKGKKKSQKKNK